MQASSFALSLLSLRLFFLSLGELVIPSQNLLNSSKHVSRDVLPIRLSRLPNGTEHATFHIPWTKTTAEIGADISITARDHTTCPLPALKHHLSANILLPTSAPLFAFETADGGWAPMTKPWFNVHGSLQRCLGRSWPSSDAGPRLSHRCRHRAVIAGYRPSVVATQGRWLSRAFLEYWRRIESILPLFISNATNSHRVRGLESSMNVYARQNRIPMSSH